MGELSADTAVDGTDGVYSARLSSDWEIWGLNGGYVASVAMRAGAAESRFSRPASITCHFLSGARFGPVDLKVVRLRQARRAESLRVTMTQDERPVTQALVWMIDGLDGLEHDHARMPELPSPHELPPIEELTPEPRSSRYSFFGNVDERPTEWIDDWEHRKPGEQGRRRRGTEGCSRPAASRCFVAANSGRASAYRDVGLAACVSRYSRERR